MARKRRRINSRVVIVFAALGVILVLFGVSLVLQGLNESRQAEALADRGLQAFEQAKEALAEGDFDEHALYSRKAARALNQALDGIDKNSERYPRLKWTYARALREQLRDRNLKMTERSEIARQYNRVLQNVVNRQPENLPAQKAYSDLRWEQMRYLRAASPKNFANEAPAYIQHLSNLHEMEPNSVEPLYRRALIRSQMAQIMPMQRQWAQDANADFSRALAIDPNDANTWIGKAAFVASQSDADAADVQAVYQKALAEAGDNVPLLCSYATHLREQGKYPEGLAMLRKAITVDPNSVLAHHRLAQFYYSQERYDKALQEANTARKIDPSFASNYVLLRHTYKVLNRPEEGLAVLKEGVEALAEMLANPKLSPDEKQRIAAARQHLYYMAATEALTLAEQKPESEASQEHVAYARQVLPALPVEDVRRANIAARLAMAKGDFRQARGILEDIPRQRRDDDTYSLMTRCYYELDEPTRAEAALRQLLQTAQRDNPRALYWTARMQLRQDKFKPALNSVQSALRSDSSFEPARHLANVLRVLNGEANALPEGTQLLPEYYSKLIAHAQDLWRDGNRKSAMQLLASIHKNFPTEPRTLALMIAWYDEAGMEEQADQLIANVEASSQDLATQLRRQREIMQTDDPQKRFEMLLGVIKQRHADDPFGEALATAQLARGLGRSELQAESLRKAASFDPNHPQVIEMSLNLAAENRDWEQVDVWLTRAQKVLDERQGKLLEAQVLQARGQYDQAVERVQEVLAEDGDDRAALLELGSINLAAERYGAAEDAYQKVLAADSSNLQAILGVARIAQLQDNPEKMREWVRRAAVIPGSERNPMLQQLTVFEIEDRIAKGQASDQEIDRVIRIRRGMMAANPRNLDNARRLGWLMEQRDDVENAERVYRHIYQSATDKLAAARPLLMLLNRTGRQGDVLRLMSELERQVDDEAGLQMLLGSLRESTSPDQAEMAYRSAIETDPNDPRPRLALGLFLARRGKFVQAVQQLEAYLKIQPDNPNVAEMLLEYKIESGDEALMTEAREEVTRRLKEDSLDPRALALRGLIAYRERQFDQAVSYLSSALTRDPSAVLPRRVLVQIHRQRGELGKAQRELAQLKKQIDTPAVAVEYARLCKQMGQYAEAESAYLGALRNNPDNAEVLAGLLELYVDQQRWGRLQQFLTERASDLSERPEFQMALYELYRHRGQIDQALAAAKRMVEQTPANRRADAYAIYLQTLLANDQPGQALEAVGELEVAPGLYKQLAPYRGRALYEAGQADAGLAVLLEAMAEGDEGMVTLAYQQLNQALGAEKALAQLETWIQGPLAERFPAKLVAARVQMSQRKYDQAIGVLQTLAEKATTAARRGEVNQALALAYQQKGVSDKALAAYQKALEDLPDNWQLLNNLAYLYAEQLNDPAGALKYARRAYELQPGNAAIVDTYGWTLAKMDKFREAEPYIRQAAGINTVDPVYRYHLGYVQGKLGRPQLARQNLELALRQAQEEGSDSGDLADKIRKQLDSLNRATRPDGE